MIFASFNPDGDLKQMAEFLDKVFLGFGIALTILIALALCWLVSKRRSIAKQNLDMLNSETHKLD